MTVELDTVLTVAVGRNGPDGKPMSSWRWSNFRSNVRTVLSAYGTVVAETTGGGVGSDGVNDGEEEESAVFVAINVHSLDAVRSLLARLLHNYGQSSACFAYDDVHEPCFPTLNGYRPVEYEPGVETRR